MITTAPTPSLRSPVATTARPASTARLLLAPGDTVSVAGEGRFALIHLTDATAWVEGLDDGSQQLVAAAGLALLGQAIRGPGAVH